MIYQCPICNSEKYKTEIEDYHGYKITECIQCGCVYCQPFKAPESDFYSEANDNDSQKRHTKIYPWPKSHPTRSSKLFMNGKGKRLLDIGCGNGAFLDFASSRNFEGIGIDIDTRSLAIAQKRNINNSTFYESSLIDFHRMNPDFKFDIISAFEVIEHLDNPKQTIELIKTMLNPEGIFVGTLPNENRFFAKKYNLEFALPPYHLTYWTKESWTSTLINFFGFQKITCDNNAYFGYLSGLTQVKLINKFNIKNNPLLFITKGFFTITGKLETFIEKIYRKSSSFYFEFKISK